MGMTAAKSSAHLATLLDRVRAGDEPALMELLQHYEPRLRIAAHVLLGPLLRPSMDSVDLVQSVHRVLLPGLREGKFDLSSPEQVLALALTIIRRKVARSWRRVQREQIPRPQHRENGRAADDPVEVAQARDLLHKLLETLSPEEQQLIELRLQGFSTVEIARKLNSQAPALRAKLSRIRQRLRSQGIDEWV
jgi:RNA polymerase sigma-70 factor (ECF subfamily)